MSVRALARMLAARHPIPGDDGASGNDTIYGGPDNDTINTVDGEPDYVACGPGSDSVAADAVDQIAAQSQDDCEKITLTQTPGTPTPGAGSAKVVGRKLNANKTRTRTRATVAIRCTSAAPCSGKAVAKAGKVVLAKGKFKAAAGKTAKVTLTR